MYTYTEFRLQPTIIFKFVMFFGFVVIQCQSFPLTLVLPWVLYEYSPKFPYICF